MGNNKTDQYSQVCVFLLCDSLRRRVKIQKKLADCSIHSLACAIMGQAELATSGTQAPSVNTARCEGRCRTELDRRRVCHRDPRA